MLIDKKAVVIIITYGRSGSTLLQTILNTAEDIHISGENGGILNLFFDSYQKLKITKNKPGRIEKSKYPYQPWYNLNNVNLKKVRRKLLNIFFADIVNPPKDCKIVGFKEIRFFQSPDDFLDLLDFLVENIPDCKFIFNSRNHDDVSQSGWWKSKPKEKVMNKLEVYENLMELANKKFSNQSHWVKYDEYVRNPESLSALYDFLNLPFDLSLVKEVLKNKLRH